MGDLGYIVIEYNQASRQPGLPPFADLHRHKDDAESEKARLEEVNIQAGRRERFAIGTIYLEDEDE